MKFVGKIAAITTKLVSLGNARNKTADVQFSAISND